MRLCRVCYNAQLSPECCHTGPDMVQYFHTIYKGDNRMTPIEMAKNVMQPVEAMSILSDIARGNMKETVIVPTMDGVVKMEKTPDAKTRISAIKELMKRYPEKDEMYKAQLRKVTAQAMEAEQRAGDSANGVTVNIGLPE
ncbi:terminase small subunit [Pediococcus phage cIP1]|uniref:Terminase small subunit n=1 Tax=Pediococcus phage cIP1 TaxID=2681621 RepID=G8FUZ3_9CAUD|nr:terminase small subunit [Pediococcus phage cIP1]AER59769.1 terminase small subunit [Pediococcus phage cIP1]